MKYYRNRGFCGRKDCIYFSTCRQSEKYAIDTRRMSVNYYVRNQPIQSSELFSCEKYTVK